jgi:hypothetical protein
MNKIIPIACWIVLAVLFFTPLAHPTNESSYKRGYTGALNEFHCLAHPPTTPGDDCGMALDFQPSNDVPCTSGIFEGIGAEIAKKWLNLNACP